MADFSKFHWSMWLRTESELKWIYSKTKTTPRQSLEDFEHFVLIQTKVHAFAATARFIHYLPLSRAIYRQHYCNNIRTLNLIILHMYIQIQHTRSLIQQMSKMLEHSVSVRNTSQFAPWIFNLDQKLQILNCFFCLLWC